MRKELKTLETQRGQTGLLVSVRDANEAMLAFAAQVDIVDIKEPRNGSLGMADIEQINSVLSVAPPDASISLALGELHELLSKSLFDMLQSLADYERIRYAKIGLSGMRNAGNWRTKWSRLLAEMPACVTPVAVAYADYSIAHSPLPLEIIDTGASLDCGAVLLDTFDKSNGNIFKHLDVHELTMLKQRAYELGMNFVLAGSINQDSLAKAVNVDPDWIAVRGAVCSKGTREKAISWDAIMELKQLLNQMMKSKF